MHRTRFRQPTRVMIEVHSSCSEVPQLGSLRHLRNTHSTYFHRSEAILNGKCQLYRSTCPILNQLLGFACGVGTTDQTRVCGLK